MVRLALAAHVSAFFVLVFFRLYLPAAFVLLASIVIGLAWIAWIEIAEDSSKDASKGLGVLGDRHE